MLSEKDSEDKSSHWTFESEIKKTEDGSIEHDTEEIDASNIIEGRRRRRTGIDYVKLDAEMTEEEKRQKALKALQGARQGTADEYAG